MIKHTKKPSNTELNAMAERISEQQTKAAPSKFKNTSSALYSAPAKDAQAVKATLQPVPGALGL